MRSVGKNIRIRTTRLSFAPPQGSIVSRKLFEMHHSVTLLYKCELLHRRNKRAVDVPQKSKYALFWFLQFLADPPFRVVSSCSSGQPLLHTTPLLPHLSSYSPVPIQTLAHNNYINEIKLLLCWLFQHVLLQSWLLHPVDSFTSHRCQSAIPERPNSLT